MEAVVTDTGLGIEGCGFESLSTSVRQQLSPTSPYRLRVVGSSVSTPRNGTHTQTRTESEGKNHHRQCSQDTTVIEKLSRFNSYSLLPHRPPPPPPPPAPHQKKIKKSYHS